MKKIFIKLTIFLIFNVFLLGYFILMLISYIPTTYGTGWSNVDQNLYNIPRNTHFDLFVLGASHAKALGDSNHSRLEEVVQKKILNIATPAGGGVVPEKILLNYTLGRGNSVDTILYVIDPFCFFSDSWNERNNFVGQEPFNLNFFIALIKGGASEGIVRRYITSKFWERFLLKRIRYSSVDNYLEKVDPEAVKKRMDALYNNGLDGKVFERYASVLDEIVQIALANKARVIFVIPPTLLGFDPGKELLLSKLLKLKEDYNIPYYDFSEALYLPQYYGNHDHLNTRGAVYFAQTFLKKVLEKNE